MVELVVTLFILAGVEPITPNARTFEYGRCFYIMPNYVGCEFDE